MAVRALIFLLACLSPGIVLPGAARADTRGITVLNRTGDILRSIQIAPAGSTVPGENRLRSSLPPNTDARIAYSTGCNVDVRLGFASGRVEKHVGLDACGNSQVMAFDGTIPASQPGTARTSGSGSVIPASKVQAAPATPPIVLAPAPPWTGRSITQRFGGLY